MSARSARPAVIVLATLSGFLPFVACGGSDSGSGLHSLEAGADGASDGALGATGGSANGSGGGGTGGAATGSGGTAGSGGTSSGGTGTGTGDAQGPDATVSCSADADCTAAGQRCDPTRKVCVDCLFDNECASGERCITGVCAKDTTCADARDCRVNTGTRTICDDATHLCVECTVDADCGAGRVCAGTTCVDSGTCTPGADAGGGCKVGEVCSPAGKCVGCVADTDCSGGTKCLASECRIPCQSDNQCTATNQLCDLNLGACVDCREDKNCASLEYCESGFCKPDVCAQGVKSCVGNSIVECTANGSGIKAPVACPDGQECVRKDATTAVCEVPLLPDGGTPAPATCSDKTKNGDETDVDCGGSCPTKCPDGDACSVDTDCQSSVCQAACSGILCLPGTRDKKCRPSSCSDQTKNGGETDVDCGGATCSRCAVDETCAVNSDCESNICRSQKCVAAPCTASQCTPCFFPTDAPCCKSSGQCGCAAVFPFPGTCQ